MKNDSKKKKLTNEVGAPVSDNDNSLTAGKRGPILLQDNWLIEKLAHFDREVIPERRMHAKGSGAFGTFTATGSVSQFTRAKVFEKNKKTEVFARFSTVAGERGAADAERDIRGFAIKFYTEEGNWDLVGNNTPVFFLRNPLHFPDLNRAVKRDPRTNMRSAQNNWDFWTLLPEALHQITITMSDRGIPYSYRHMHGFGSHTFSLINDKNERVWVKFHFKTMQGIKNLTDQEAAKIIATNRESHQEDLYNSIEKGDFPKWKLCFQIMTEQQANNHKENPFDITKVWSQKQYPLIEVGILELNRNPDNYFAEVEQVAFSPSHVVPGIGLSPDTLLQGRLFSYGDTQRYRLGVNHDQIPVNKARVEVNSSHRDGQMRVDGNYGSTVAYHPNSQDVWSVDESVREPELSMSGTIYRYEPRDDITDNCFYQAGDLYRLMNQEQKTALINNTVNNIMPVTDNIKYRHAVHCYLADKDYGERFTKECKLDLAKVIELSKLSHTDLIKATKPISK